MPPEPTTAQIDAADSRSGADSAPAPATPRRFSLDEALKAGVPDESARADAPPASKPDEEPASPAQDSPVSDSPAEDAADRDPSTAPSPTSRRGPTREKLQQEADEHRAARERAETALKQRDDEVVRVARAVGAFVDPSREQQLRAARAAAERDVLAYDPDNYSAEAEQKYREGRQRVTQIDAELTGIDRTRTAFGQLAAAAHLAFWLQNEASVREMAEQYGADLKDVSFKDASPRVFERVCAAVDAAARAEVAEQLAERDEKIATLERKLAGHAKEIELGGQSAPSRRGPDGGFDPRRSPHENLDRALAPVGNR